jgi:alpha-L-rhamnosidase
VENLVTPTSSAPNTALTVTPVRFEHLSEPLGLGVDRPRLSWTVATHQPNWTQSAYEVEALAGGGQVLAGTGRVASSDSVLVAWPFAPLRSRERLTVRARVWGPAGGPSEWSAPATVEAGLLEPSDWSAQFVAPAWPENKDQANPCPYLRREFELRAAPRRARLYITALGVYEAYLNGQPVSDHVLAPGWTSYHHRLRYQTLDVTPLLHAGRNALGAILGDGWYRGRLGYGGGQRNIYGERLALLAQLEIEYPNGGRERITSDPAWRAATGPLLASELYDGETYDARLEQPGWAMARFNDAGWSAVEVIAGDLARLVAPSGPPVRRTQTQAPISITPLAAGRWRLDFGQNLVGRLRLTVNGPAGQTLTLRHSEVLEQGELATRPLRYAAATDRYTLRGGGPERYEPRFTYHGFRYAEVAGWPGELSAADVQAVVCHSDLERTGWFECSDPLLNRLHENIVWSMRGNFLDLPTDCPQRDERLGWTGDIQVFSPTACYLFDCAGFLSSWLADLAAEQAAAGGQVPFFVPAVPATAALPAAAWGDAAVIVPWVLYEHYGDLGILQTQFASMRAWVDLVAGLAGEKRLWDTGVQFGDWLDPSAPPDKPGHARAAPEIVATAYLARSAELVGRAANLLGRAAEAARYLDLAAEVRAAFAREYVTPQGRLMSDAPTAYALALEFALLPQPEQRQRAGQRLAELLRQGGDHISTGFVGTPLVCDALCSAGDTAAAYRLLLQRECPSWLYMVTMGATTIWERWDSLLPDGSVNPGEMTSFNHYALGAVADWLHRVVGGLAPAEPGYHRLRIAPRPGGGLTHARARLRTPYGPASCAWHVEAGAITVGIEVPPNATAEVSLPGREGEPLSVGAGQHTWTYPYAPPLAARPSLSLDSDFADILANAEAYGCVMRLMAEHSPDIADRLISPRGVSLRQLALLTPNAEVLLPKLAAALGKEDDGR